MFKKKFHALRSQVRSFCAQYPAIYFSQQRNLYGFIDSNRMVAKDTDIVIEGFPGSANTFAVNAFKLAQSKPIKIAHHFHDYCSLIVAAKAKIPGIILIRYPDDAISSYLTRFANLNMSQEKSTVQLISAQINKYSDFYSNLVGFRDDLIVADFKTVTTSMDLVISKVNAKYKTNFTTLPCDSEYKDKVFKLISEQNHKNFGVINEQVIPRPSKDREKINKNLRNLFQKPELEALFVRAQNIYKLFIS